MGVKAKGEGLAPVEDCWPGEEVSRHLLLLLQDLNEAHTLSSLEERGRDPLLVGLTAGELGAEVARQLAELAALLCRLLLLLLLDTIVLYCGDRKSVV